MNGSWARTTGKGVFYPYISNQVTMAVDAYCVKCRAKREMKDAKEVAMKGRGTTERRAMKGVCSVCGTGMYKILPAAKK